MKYCKNCLSCAKSAIILSSWYLTHRLLDYEDKASDRFVAEVFGHDENGRFYGGGRKDKGGFQIPLGVFAQCSDRELLWILIKKTIDELFYQKIGVEEQSDMDSDITTTKV